MSWWTSIRDSAENATAALGDVMTLGQTNVFDNARSRSAQAGGSVFTSMRDQTENAALAIADYYTGGAASVLGGLRSQSAQSSLMGQMVGIGGELYGLGNLAYSGYNALAGTEGLAGASQGLGSGLSTGGDATGLSAGAGGVTGLTGTLPATQTTASTGGLAGLWGKLTSGTSAGGLSGDLHNAGAAYSGSPLSHIASILSGLSTMRAAQTVQNNPALDQIRQLMANPSSVYNMPGSQAALDAIVREQAATGNLGSGQLQAALASEGSQLYTNALQGAAGAAAPLTQAATLGATGTSQGLGLLAGGLNGLNFSSYGHAFGG